MDQRLHVAALALAAFCSGCDQLVTVEPVEDSSAAETHSAESNPGKAAPVENDLTSERAAAKADLDSLKEYTSDWLRIQERLRRVETSIQAAEERKLERLEEWRRFEENRLPVIAEYIERQHSERVSYAGGRYQIPGALLNDHIILLACEIGERRLFFDLTQGTHSDHPFRLIAMGH